jgi:hypothetical protein
MLASRNMATDKDHTRMFAFEVTLHHTSVMPASSTCVVYVLVLVVLVL